MTYQAAIRYLLFILLTAHCFLLTALGQSTTATLNGTVEDPNGAVVPGTTVTAVNIATTLRRQVVTGEDGYFVLPLLPPGTYTVRVEHQGFAPVQIENVILNVGDQKALQIQLSAGNISEMVKVTAEAPLINESPAVGTVVDRQFVENIPLNGRSFNALIALTPGVVTTPSSFAEKGQFSVNGQRPDTNYFTIDGVSANAPASTGNGLGQSGGGAVPATSALGGTNNLVSVDALQEFRIQTSTYAPEFGRTPGAQVQIVTRSGTNRFNGNLFEYFRNDVFDANDWFGNLNNLPRPAVRQSDFGGVVGGPIIKNKTFFFFSYEGLRLRQPRVATSNVPTLQTRLNAAPGLRPFLNAFPLANGTDFGNGLAAFNASFSLPSSLDATSIRIDHNLSKNLTLFGRYNHAPSESLRRGASASSLNTKSFTKVSTDTLTVGSTWAISGSKINELRFNYTKTGGESFIMLDEFGGAVIPADSVFFPSPFSSKDALVSLSFLSSANLSLGKNVTNTQRQINIVDSQSIVYGTHALKFGFDYRRLQPTFGPRPYDQNVFLTTLAGVNSGTAAFAFVGANNPADLFYKNFSVYGQDTWKIGRHLTLTYGLRWDVNPPPSGKKRTRAICSYRV